MTQNITEIEQALAGLALSGADLAELTRIVDPADFHSPTYKAIWNAAVSISNEGGNADVNTVSAYLAKNPAGRRHIDPIEVIDAVSIAPYIVQGEWYATQVAAAAERRRIGAAAIAIAQISENEALEISAVRERARQELENALTLNTKTGPAPIADIFQRVIDNAENKTSPTLSTGWPDLDRLLGGFAPGRLVVIGARPAVGKSLTGTNLARHFAGTHGHAVLVASMEMNGEEVVQRITADIASVNVSRLAEARLEEREWEAIADKAAEISDLPIYVGDNPSQTVTSIRADALAVKRIRPDLAVIVVDYLQLMESGARSTNRTEAVGQISRGLKVLARDTNTCVVAMAQLNRESLKHGDGRPRMSDLRESGSIEADANVVILLHRADEDVPEVEAIVEKNRHGSKGSATLRLEGHFARLASVGWSPSRGAV